MNGINNKILEDIAANGEEIDRDYIFDSYKPLGETVEFKGWNPNEKRNKTLQQYFTPYPVVEFITDALNLRHAEKAIVLDNSCGMGRMFRYLHPATRVMGIEIEDNAYKVARALYPKENAKIVHGNLLDYILPIHSIDVSLLNPPFSIHLEKRNIKLYNAQWGAMGYRSSIQSHIAALEIAIRATSFYVACVLPTTFFSNESTRTFEKWIKGHANEILKVDLPATAHTGANWATSIVIYDVRNFRYNYRDDAEVFYHQTNSLNDLNRVLDEWKSTEHYKLVCVHTEEINEYPKRDVRFVSPREFIIQEVKKPTLPCTGKEGIKVCLNAANTAITIKSTDLLTALKVKQHQDSLGEQYNNATKRYVSQWWINARRPEAFYNTDITGELKDSLKYLGCDCEIDPQIHNVHDKLQRWNELQKATFEQWVLNNEGGEGDGSSAWELKNKDEGMCAKYPQLYREKEKKLDRILAEHPNLELWNWQKHDVVRMSMKQHAVLATDMGLGKTRMGIAIALMHGCKHNLIITESKLIGQFAGELKMFGCDFNIITKSSDTKNLKLFNLIAYSRIWMKATKGKTFAKALKKRCNFIMLDEAHNIKANDSNRALACRSMHPKHWVLSSGTPIANYPRNIFSLLVCAFGDGTELFKYGYHTPYIQNYGVTSGTRKFREHFVTVDSYISNQFEDTLDKGKRIREFPIVKDIELWHELLAPMMIRRCRDEPEIMREIKIPEPEVHEIWVKPTKEHLDYYRLWLDEFAEWFLAELKAEQDGDHKMDMIMLLVQIGKLQFVSTIPQSEKIKSDVKIAYNWNGNLTSKQEEVIKLASEYVNRNKKIIIYSERPELQTLLAKEFSCRGINALVFTGKQPIQKREEILRDFKIKSNYPILLATTTVGGTGLNIPQASIIIFADQSWTPAIHDQAIARVCRPQQTEKPIVFKLLHEGMVDEYMKQMMDVKAEGIKEAVDWQAHTFDPNDWLSFRDMSYRYLKDEGYI